MKVLISAYACEPDVGSEPEVGLQTAYAASQQHDVWVVTRANNIEGLRGVVDTWQTQHEVHLIGHDSEGLALRLKKKLGPLSMHMYYDYWQRTVASVARELDAAVGFDVVHHSTLAAYWTRVGVAAVPKPLVWGPIGGGARPPLRLVPTMGWRGAVGDTIRVITRPVVARVNRATATARRASVVLFQNLETANILGAQATDVLPNALAAATTVTRNLRNDRPPPGSIVMLAGRLMPLKAFGLAIEAMSYLRSQNVDMHIYGDGVERNRLQHKTRRLGLQDRVHFHGHVSRQRLVAMMSRASVVVHPALHEEAGFVVAEALALGVPVVCLATGGPPVLADEFPRVPSRVIEPGSPSVTARKIARAIEELATGGPGPTSDCKRDYSAEILRSYELAVDRGYRPD